MNLIKWFQESTSLYKHTPALYERCLQISFPGSMFGAHSRQQRTSTNKTETQQRLTIAFSYFVTVVRQKIYLYLTLCEPISDHHTAIDLNQKTVLFFKPSPSRQTSSSSLFNGMNVMTEMIHICSPLQTEALTLPQVSNLGRQRKLLPAWFTGLLDETSHLMTDVWSSRWGSSSTPGAARRRKSPSGFTQTLFMSHGRSARCRRSNGEKAAALLWRDSWEDQEVNQDTNRLVKNP